MTYLELYEDALRKLHNSLITLGEFEMMVKPLNREVEAEPKTGHWIDEETNYLCSKCHRGCWVNSDYCPWCGADMRGEEG